MNDCCTLFSDIYHFVRNMRQPPTNCVVCLLRPLYFIGKLGASVLDYHCPHYGKKQKKAEFTRSKIYTFCNAGLAIFFFGVLVLDVHQVITTSMSLEAFLFMINRILVCVGVLSIVFFNNLYARNKINELNGLIAIVENRAFYDIEDLIELQQMRNVFKLSILMIVLHILFEVDSIIEIVNTILIRDYPDLSRKLVWQLCEFISLTVSFHTFCTVLLYRLLFCKCYTRIKDVLTVRLSFRTPSASSVFGDSTNDIGTPLTRLRMFYTCLVINYREFNRYFNPVFLHWWTLVLLTMINNVYILVRHAFKRDLNLTLEHGILEVKFSLFMFPLVFYLYKVEEVTDGSDDITSFLFRYPISKLSRAEAAQVEILITTLHTQKPILKASEVFTIGTNLMASITGTVITYVLVALQFHATWAKQ